MDANRKEHLTWIDSAKGLCLILVVFGHLLYHGKFAVLNRAIYSFHMPLYFILSGFITSNKSSESFFQFLKKQLFRLLIPTILFIILLYPIYLSSIDLSSFNILHEIKTFCFYDGKIPYNSPCWFFIVLFEAKVILKLLPIGNKPVWFKAISCFSFFVVGYLLYKTKLFIPFGLDRCIVVLGFMVFGMLLKDVYWKYRENKKAFILALLCMIPIWFISGIVLNGKVSMYGFNFSKHYWMFVAAGISGTIAFLIVVILLTRIHQYFLFWGQNTVFIVCSHYIFVTLFVYFTGKIGIQYTTLYTILALVYSLVILLCYIPVCKFVNKYLPILNGRIKLKNKEA